MVKNMHLLLVTFKMLTVIVLSVLVFGIGNSVCDNIDENPKLRCYEGSLDKYFEVQLDSAEDALNTSWFRDNRDTVIFTHGFTGHPDGPAVKSVISAYLEEGKSNVALLNWQYKAASRPNSMLGSYLNWALPNAKWLGATFATTLQNMSRNGLNLEKLHLVGHSIGAHVFGITGNNLMREGVALPWITGLDPANAAFDMKPLNLKLHPGSALFVDVIHSDPNKYGYRSSMGTVDFWPNYRNGPFKQPGCEEGRLDGNGVFTQKDLCNHNRSWELLVDSIKYPNSLIGSHARNFRTWKKYSQDERRSVSLAIGQNPSNVTPGDYYLITAGKSPFGLGVDGL